MELPIASAELVRTLRRPLSFAVAGGYYTALVVAALIGWISLEGRLGDREEIGRGIFHAFLFLGYGLLSIHAALIGANSLVGEREGNTSTLLRLAPIRHSSLVIQKLLAPLAMEWLFFIGSLPFLSLVFLLGGLSGAEFLYQLVNLFVWLNSCILLGLWVSSTAPSATRAGRNVFAALALLVVLTQFGGFLLEVMPRGLESLHPDWSRNLRWLEALFNRLSTLSPIWMVRSWSDSALSGLGSTTGGGVHFPALFSWCAHLLIQALLLWRAVRGWERTPEKPEIESGRGGWLARLGLRRVRRGHHGPFPEGWRAYFELEDREVFKGGRRTKRLLWVPALIWMVAFFAIASSWSPLGVQPGGSATLVEESLAQLGVTVSSFALILIGLGLAPNAFRRHTRRDSSGMALLSPVPPWEVFLGKWLYYQTFCLKALLFLGFVFVFPLVFTWSLGVVRLGTLAPVGMSLGGALLSIPVVSFFGVLAGLYAWTARTGAVVLLLFAVCAMNCFACLAIPIGIVLAISLLVAGPVGNIHYEEPKWLQDSRMCCALGVLGFVLLDTLVFSFHSSLRPLSLWKVLFPALITLNLLFLTATLSLACWVWILGRPMEWWRRKLLTA
ncbi:MAG: hypothetical protein GHCLOJNM_01634 [bacterium]|nr:hypothetical protein [bacterium]